MNRYIIDIRIKIKENCSRKKNLCKALKLYLRNTKHEFTFKYDIDIFRIKNYLSEIHITTNLLNPFDSLIDSKSLILRKPFDCAIYDKKSESFFYIENNTLYYQDMVKKEYRPILTLPDNIEDTQSDLVYKTINDFLSKEAA